MVRFGGCGRFLWNALLAEQNEEYREYMEEIESRLTWGEAKTADEAAELTVKPTLAKFTFTNRLKSLKDIPFSMNVTLRSCSKRAWTCIRLSGTALRG